MLLIDAATSYKKYNDTSGNPTTPVVRRLDAAAEKSFDELRQAHVAEHQRLFRRVALDLGTTAAAKLPTDERIKGFAAGHDPQSGGPLFPVRPLPAHQFLAARAASRPRSRAFGTTA